MGIGLHECGSAQCTIFGSLITQAVYNAQLYKRLEDKVMELQTAKRTLEETQIQLIQFRKTGGIGHWPLVWRMNSTIL